MPQRRAIKNKFVDGSGRNMHRFDQVLPNSTEYQG